MTVSEPHEFIPGVNPRYARSCKLCGRVEDWHWYTGSLTAVETASGLYFDYLDPKPEQVELEDIAYALARVCRFRGHVEWYSVAEHSIRVAQIIYESTADPALALAALHHDSHEAYLGDWPTPLKRAMHAEDVEEIENRCNAVIGYKLHIDPALFKHPAVKRVDKEMRYREAATFLPSQGISPEWQNGSTHEPLVGAGWGREQAQHEFIRWHGRLLIEREDPVD